MQLNSILNTLGTFQKVEHVANNQVFIYFAFGIVFQSYNTIIAVKSNGIAYLNPNWENSATTNKYRCQFLGKDKKGTTKDIKEGFAIVWE